MNRTETSKPQYQIRPTFWIHADGDAEAESRLDAFRGWLGEALRVYRTQNPAADQQWPPGLRVGEFMYDDFSLESGHLIVSGWPDEEERVVR